MLNSKLCAGSENSVRVAADAGGGRRGAGRALALAVLLPALLALGGCASGYNGLPNNVGFPSAAGFRVVSATLSDGVAGRTYSFYVLLHGGTAPFNCATGITGMPTGLSATSTTVPSGAQAGTAACLIMGPVAANAAAGSPYTLSFNLRDSSSPALVTSATLSLIIRPEFTVMAPPTATNDGVVGLSYGVAPKSSTATTTVSATVGNGPLTACAFAAGTNLMGNPLGVTVSGTANCALASTANLTTASTLSLTITATDTAIVDPITGLQVVPPNTISSAAAALKIDAALAFMTGLPAAPMKPWDVNTPAAIAPYLNMTPSLTVTTTGGLPIAQTTYTCTDSGATTFASLGLTVATVAPNCTLSGTPTATATNAAVAISVTNTGNAAVPANPAIVTSSTLTINAQAVVTTAEAAFVAGVTNTDSAGAAPNRPYSVTVSAGTAAAPGTGTLTLSATNLNAGSCLGLSLTTAMTAEPVTSPVMGNPSASVTAPATATCSFSVSETDGIATNTSNFTIAINPPLRVTAPAALPDAVTDRTYTLPAGVVKITGGLPPYTSCVAAGQPAQMTGSLSGTSCLLASTSNPITVGGPTGVTFTVMDMGDLNMGNGTAAGTSSTPAPQPTLTVRAMLAFTESGLALTGGPPTATLPLAVNSASYALNGAGPPAQSPLQYTVTGGTGVGTTLAGTGTSGGLTCTYAAPVLTCKSASITAAGGTNITYGVTATDTGNIAVPNGNVTADTAMNTMYTIPVNAALTFTESGLALTGGPPTATLPNAVTASSYALAGAGPPAQSPLQYTVAGGTGVGTTLAGTGTSGGFTCTFAATMLTCKAATITAGGGTSITFGVTATDTGNAAVPNQTVTADTAGNTMYMIAVKAAVMFTESGLALTGGPPTATLPNAVTGSSYALAGAGPPAQAGLLYTVSGGTGSGGGTTLAATGTSGGLACTFAAPMLTCKSNSITTAGGGNITFGVTATDPGNAAVPTASFTADTAGNTMYMIPVNAAVKFTESGLTLTGGPPTAALPNAVTGRSYALNGAGPPAQSPLLYTVSGGTGSGGGTTLAATGTSGGLACAFASPTLTCTANPMITAAGGTNIMFGVTATDPGNAAVPSASFTADTAGNTMYTIAVKFALSFSENYGITAALPDAVDGRTYGSGFNNCNPTSACADVIFTGAGGLPPYVFTGPPAASLPTPITCTAGATLDCNSGGAAVTGAAMTYSPLTVSIADTGDAAVPALTPALTTDKNGNASFSLKVDATFTLTPPARVPNALLGFPYPAGVTFSETGGTGVTDTFVFGTAAAGTCTASAAPPAPPGITIGAVSGTLSGTATVASKFDTDYTFNVCVSDTGNFSTPGGALQTGTAILLNELNTFAAAAGTGSATIEVINYGTNSYFNFIPLPAGAKPSGGAVDTGGARFFVADNAHNTIIALSTITGNILATAATPAGCGLPTEIAATPNPTAAGFDRLYVVCTDTAGAHVAEVAVFDITTGAMFTAGAIAEIPTGVGSAPYAVAIQSDNSHAFVTLNGTNQLFVIDNTLATPAPVLSSPFALDPATSVPTGIAVTANGAKVYAYIGKDGFGNQPTAVAAIAPAATPGASEAGNTVTITTAAAHGFTNGQFVTISGVGLAGYNIGPVQITVTSATMFTYTDPTAGLANSGGGTATPDPQQGIEVVDVTGVGTSVAAGTAPLVTDILLTAGTLPNPDDVAVDPTNAFVYVTFPGTNQFTVVNNAAAPTQVAGNPFNLPDPTMAAADTPGGVTVPPVLAAPVLAYFTANNLAQVDVITQGTPPTKDLSITGLTAGSMPGRIKYIPIPQ